MESLGKLNKGKCFLFSTNTKNKPVLLDHGFPCEAVSKKIKEASGPVVKFNDDGTITALKDCTVIISAGTNHEKITKKFKKGQKIVK